MSSQRASPAADGQQGSGLRHWLVGLYPPAWRARYGDEFDILVEECLHSPLDILDVILGALDAHVEFALDLNWRSINMINKLRTSILIVFAAYIAFVIGGLSLYGLADDSPMASLMKTNVPLAAAWIAVQVGAVVALLAVIIGGAPVAFAVVRRALTSSRRDLRYLLVPVVAFAALVVYAAFAAAIGLGRLQVPGVLPSVSQGNFPIGNRLLIGGFMTLFVLGAIASTAAVWKAVAGIGDEPLSPSSTGKPAAGPYQFALVPALITALSMLWMALATLGWGWLSFSAMPDVFASNWGLLQTNTTFSLALTLVIMLGSTALAFFGLVRGYSARKLAH